KVRVRTAIADATEGSDVQVGASSVHLGPVEIERAGRGEQPKPQQFSVAEQFSSGGLHEARRVRTLGTVRAAKSNDGRLLIELADKGMRLSLTLLDSRDVEPRSLIDARIEATGVLQLGYQGADVTSTGVHLWVSRPTDLRIVTPSARQIPLVPSVRSLIAEPQWAALEHRVRVRGRVLERTGDTVVLIESGGTFM